jgi:hypothetical protein
MQAAMQTEYNTFAMQALLHFYQPLTIRVVFAQ